MNRLGDYAVYVAAIILLCYILSPAHSQARIDCQKVSNGAFYSICNDLAVHRPAFKNYGGN